MQPIDIANAADALRQANRISVVGCSGGGKSTLSQHLAKHLDLTYISIDRDIFWLPGWVERDKSEQRRLMGDMVACERWVVDGSNPSTFDIRIPRTDVVIWMRMPRLVCLWGVATRWFKWIGRTRPEMAPGCPEKLDWSFVRFVWTFEARVSPRIIAGIAQHGPDIPVFQLKSRRQMRTLLDLLDVPA